MYVRRSFWCCDRRTTNKIGKLTYLRVCRKTARLSDLTHLMLVKLVGTIEEKVYLLVRLLQVGVEVQLDS